MSKKGSVPRELAKKQSDKQLEKAEEEDRSKKVPDIEVESADTPEDTAYEIFTRSQTGGLLPKDSRAGFFPDTPLPDEIRRGSRSRSGSIRSVSSVSSVVSVKPKQGEMASFLNIPKGTLTPEMWDELNALASKANLVIENRFEGDDREKDIERSKNVVSDRGRSRSRGREMDDAASLASDKDEGLGSVLTHIVKPIGTLLDRDQRNDANALIRAERHLNKVTNSSVDHAMRSEISDVLELVEKLTKEVAMLKLENTTKTRATTQKAGTLRPHRDETNSLPPAPEDLYSKALQSMSAQVKIIERGTLFKDAPYDFALQVCSASNPIASNYMLSVDQQLGIIFSNIPNTSAVYKELTLLSKNITQLFEFVSTTSTILSTKSELEAKIEAWVLDTSSFPALSTSIGQLKFHFIELEDVPLEQIDQQGLYLRVVARIKREHLSLGALKNLDEARIRIERESNPLELHQILLSSLRYLVDYRPRNNNNNKKPNQNSPQVKAVDSVTESDSQKEQAKKPAKKKDKNKQDKDWNKKPKDSGYADKKGSSKKKYYTVEPWPRNKPYTTKSGNGLTKEIELHFQDSCWKCGHSSHRARQCRLYDDKVPCMTLCNTCRTGFHSNCKSYRPLAVSDGPLALDSAPPVDRTNWVQQVVTYFPPGLLPEVKPKELTGADPFTVSIPE